MRLRAVTLMRRRHPKRLLRSALLSVAPRYRLIDHVSDPSRTVCLTFDDGPDPDGTPRVLEMLRTHRARATFFVQGANALEHRPLLRRIAADGHEIGHHSWSHGEPGATSARALIAEVHQTRELLRREVGIDARLFRPPHGKLTARKLLGLWTHGQRVVLWSYDPGDVFAASGAALEQWCMNNPIRPGDIVLLHDRAAALIDGLPALLRQIQKAGLRAVSLSEALRCVPHRVSG